MSTVIGLLQKDRPLRNVTKQLNAAGCALNQIKIVTRPGEVHTLLDKNALHHCKATKCMGTGALIGLSFFMPLGLMAAWVGCTVLGCSPFIWLDALIGLSLIGAIIGAVFGCFFSADHYERDEHLYTEAVGWGNKLVVVEADTPETETRAAQILQQEHAIAVKVLQ